MKNGVHDTVLLGGRKMKKGTFLALVLLALCTGGAYSDEIEYVVTQDTYLDSDNAWEAALPISAGETVYFEGGMDIFHNRDYGSLFALNFSVRTEQGRTGWINAGHVSLKNTLPLPGYITEKRWIYSFYQQFLLGYPRETLFDHEPFWRDDFTEFAWRTDLDLAINPWYRAVSPTTFDIRDNLILMENIYARRFIHFAVAGWHEDADAIILSVICVNMNYNTDLQNRLINRFGEGGTYRLTLKIDGDYMDVFVDDDGQLVATLIGVDDYFATAVEDFFHDETKADLSRIIWPRRADGSMDFPPPEGASLTFRADDKERGELAEPIRPRDRQSRSQTTDRLRVRENPDASSAIVTTLDTGTEVQVLETGNLETIGGITAPWVKVLSANGFTGWAFSGYLESLAPEQENPDSANQEPENVEAQNLDSLKR